MTSRARAALGGAVLLAAALAVPATTTGPAGAAPAAAPAVTAAVTVTHGCVASVPEPGSRTPVRICYSIFKPRAASARHRVPMIMHSHGWGGSRTRSAAAFADLTRAGYGVLSFDQRGWGESGGRAHVENPAFEGRDVLRLVRLVSRLRWVRQDATGDPRLGAIGGSYGGGYQFVGAFESLRLRGKPVFDALAPEITWNDLNESIAPEGVTRTEWALLLSAAAAPSDALPPSIYKALVEGAATGQWPDGSVPGTEDVEAFFEKNGPAWHVRHGRRLDIPVLFGQGTTDTLFPLEQGLTSWRTAITPRARRHSMFVGYNGGHVLPAVLPQGVDVTSDPCSRRLAGGDFRRLSIRFFDEQLKGLDRRLRGYGRIHLATPDRGCRTVSRVTPNATRRIGTVVSTTAAGVPLPHEIARGPITVVGRPHLTGAVTALGVESRAFYGLAVGTSPADARLVQNNVLPLREPTPVTGVRRRVALPAVSVDVPRGKKLFLLVTPVSDTFAGMGSRTPGVITIDDTVVHLPLARR